jgi:glucosylceramidase
MKRLENNRNRFQAPSLLAASSSLALAICVSACVAPEAIDSNQVGSTSQALVAGTTVQVTFSSELNPKDHGWYTNNWEGSIAYKLDAQPALATAAPNGAAITAINVDPATQYQTIEGIGSSMEESTVYNLMRMNTTVREQALREMFTQTGWGLDKGIGMSLARVCLGTSDFTSRPFYTYENFSIQNDINYSIISILQQAKSYSSNLRFFGSPWSPPGYMKTSGNIIGGSLSGGQEGPLAAYLRQAVVAYQSQGLKLYALTMQNEPLYFPPAYPGSGMVASQQLTVAKDLRTELNNNGQNDVKILAFDHNFADVYGYLPTIMNDSGGYAAVDGTAFHDYSGAPSAMTDMHNSYPNKGVQVTERTVWGVAGADRIVQYFRNWAKSYNAWVTMLDSNNQPTKWSGVPDPTMMIMSASSPNTYWRTPEFYILGQFSKFVQPGATRISSDAGSSTSVTDVVFKNPDGKIVAVVVNQTASAQTFKLLSQGQQITATLPAKTVGTYRWQSDPTTATIGLNTTFQAENGFQSGGVIQGGTSVGYFDGGDYMAFSNVNLTGATGLNMQIASGNSGGVIEVHADSVSGTLLGSYTVASTGGWTTWVNRNVPFTTTLTGNHALFIRGAGGTGVANFDYFSTH